VFVQTLMMPGYPRRWG